MGEENGFVTLVYLTVITPGQVGLGLRSRSLPVVIQLEKHLVLHVSQIKSSMFIFLAS